MTYVESRLGDWILLMQMPDAEGWLVITTAVLALATVWLARGSRMDRIDQRMERERRLLRSAILEQIDNCRQWLPSAAVLDMANRRPPPAVARLSDLLDGLTLPADLTLFLT